jgi:hypothetical protein
MIDIWSSIGFKNSIRFRFVSRTVSLTKKKKEGEATHTDRANGKRKEIDYNGHDVVRENNARFAFKIFLGAMKTCGYLIS